MQIRHTGTKFIKILNKKTLIFFKIFLYLELFENQVGSRIFFMDPIPSNWICNPAWNFLFANIW